MALATASRSWTSPGTSCGYGDSHATENIYLNTVSWGRNTGNCEQSSLSVNITSDLRWDSLVWASHNDPNFHNNGMQIRDNLQSRHSGYVDIAKGGTPCSYPTGCCFCHCGGVTYSRPAFNTSILGDKSTYYLYVKGWYLGNGTGEAYYTLPNNLRVLPPTGLSVTWPSLWDEVVKATLGSWSSNSNIGGTPTSYPRHKNWNFAIELLDEHGNYLAHQLFNTRETKNVSSYDIKTGWYTADALAGTAAANSTKYTLLGGRKYRFRVVANNNMNQQAKSTSSAALAYDIPTPKVSITDSAYDAESGKDTMTFSWSKEKSGIDERIEYEVWCNGEKIQSGTLVEHTNGEAKSGTVTLKDIPTGENIEVRVLNKANDGSQTKTGSVEQHSPVITFATVQIAWNDVRRECTITGTVPGARFCHVYAGYKANEYEIGDKLTPANTGTLVVKDLDHGTGQILYIQVVPESQDGYEYVNETVKLSVHIPNPILGIATAIDKKRYIVDVVEHKKGGTVTPKWQNGDRIVKK